MSLPSKRLKTKTQIVDPYPKIRKQNPRNFQEFSTTKNKKSLLGLVSYNIFPTDVLRWRGRFHNHVQNKSTKNKKSLLGLGTS